MKLITLLTLMMASDDLNCQMSEEERLAYYQEAMKRGLESRLVPPFFTCIGKMKVAMMEGGQDMKVARNKGGQEMKVARMAAMAGLIVGIMVTIEGAIIFSFLMTGLCFVASLFYIFSSISNIL